MFLLFYSYFMRLIEDGFMIYLLNRLFLVTKETCPWKIWNQCASLNSRERDASIESYKSLRYLVASLFKFSNYLLQPQKLLFDDLLELFIVYFLFQSLQVLLKQVILYNPMFFELQVVLFSTFFTHYLLRRLNTTFIETYVINRMIMYAASLRVLHFVKLRNYNSAIRKIAISKIISKIWPKTIKTKNTNQTVCNKSKFIIWTAAMSEDRESQIIQISLLKWIQVLTREDISSFKQLVQGSFYLEFLTKVSHFKFIKPLKDLSYQIGDKTSLANRVSNTKIIGESIVRYYQTYLMKDVSQMKINYVQLCMGSSSQSIKLFSLLIGIFALQGENQTFKQLKSSIQNLHPDDQYIVKALLQNSKNIGESMSKSEDCSIRDKIITKLENYEQKIQNLESEIQHLKDYLQEEKNINQSNQAEIKELKHQKAKLVQKSQVLQVLNARLEAENSSFIMENENLVKKIDSQKRHYEQILLKNKSKLSSYQKQMTLVDSMKNKIQELIQANSDLKQEVANKNDYLKGEQFKFKMMKGNYTQLQESYKKLQQKCNKIELQYQEYKFRKQTDSGNSDQRNRAVQSPGYRISNNSQLSSIKYRVRDRLESAMKGQLSGYQMINSHISKNRGLNSYGKGNSNLRQQHELGVSNCQNNLSNLVINQIGNPNIHDIQDVSQFKQRQNGLLRQQKLDESIIVEDYDENQTVEEMKRGQQFSLLKNKTLKSQVHSKIIQNTGQIGEKSDPSKKKQFQLFFQKIQDQTSEEYSVLVMIIEELYRQNLKISSQLRRFQELKTVKTQRLQTFKKKLQKVRQIQSLQSLNLQFDKMKQNITPNKMPFPLTFQHQPAGNAKKKSKDNINKTPTQYPFYQMTLN